MSVKQSEPVFCAEFSFWILLRWKRLVHRQPVKGFPTARLTNSANMVFILSGTSGDCLFLRLRGLGGYYCKVLYCFVLYCSVTMESICAPSSVWETSNGFPVEMSEIDLEFERVLPVFRLRSLSFSRAVAKMRKHLCSYSYIVYRISCLPLAFFRLSSGHVRDIF